MIGLSPDYLRPGLGTVLAVAVAFGLGFVAGRVPFPELVAGARSTTVVAAIDRPAIRQAVEGPKATTALSEPGIRIANSELASRTIPSSPEPATIVGPEASDDAARSLTALATWTEKPAAAPEQASAAAVDGTKGPVSAALSDLHAIRSDLHSVKVRAGDTLLGILMRVGIDRAEAHEAVESIKGVYDPSDLRVGQALEIAFQPSLDAAASARLASLSLGIDLERGLKLVRADDGSFAASTIDKPLREETALATGEIRSSLYEAAGQNGMPPEMVAAFVKLLSWDVDFQRDLQPGNRFEALFERSIDEDGRMVRSGDLLFGRLQLEDRELVLYRFEGPDGRVGWYDRSGRSARKSLLRTPVDGARLSSTFGMRKHPILGFSRMHKGIDFAAPIGTPVFAAGDGVIEFAGRHAGYGKYVRIRHNGTYSTAYAHLSRYGRSIASGTRVQQGQVIGYVGTTGMSTGPHLHYEILERGKQVNPLKVRQDVVDSLEGAELKRFQKHRDEIDRMRRTLASPTLVAAAGDQDRTTPAQP